MLVILDTNMLTLLLKPEIPPPNDPSTKAPVVKAAERLELLLDQLAKDQSRILIPTPVWAEFLVAAGDSGPAFAAQLKDRANFEFASFDAISAVEAAIDQRRALKTGNKKAELDASRQCVKADRQIVAIGKTRKVGAIYAADKDIVKIGKTMDVDVIALWDLPLPPEELSKTPLLDLVGGDTDTEPGPSTIEVTTPSVQSPGGEKPTPTPPAPAPLSVPQAVQGTPPQDSSPSAAEPPRSKQ